jgi:hypothetical protein
MSSSIFIKLSEQENGEIDLILTPYLKNKNLKIKASSFDTFFYDKESSLYSNISMNYNKTNFLNFYEIRQKLSNLFKFT